jgi:hypothetical protein
MSLPASTSVSTEYHIARDTYATTSVVGESVAIVAPFSANAAGTSAAGVVAQQADQITFGGIQAVFEKVLSEEQAVALLNSFSVTEQNGSPLSPDYADDKDPKFNVDIVSDVSGFKAVLEAIINNADEVYGSANVAGKKVKSYLEEEMRVQIVKQLSSSSLSDMLEASNVSNVVVTLNVPAGSADMATKIGAADAAAAAKRKLFMTQIPKSTLSAYIPENATEINFLPMRGADSITFIYDLNVAPPSSLELIQTAPSSINLGTGNTVSSSPYANGTLDAITGNNFLTTSVVRRVAFVAHLTGLPAYFLRDSSGKKLETTAKRIADKANDLSGSLAALKTAVDASASFVSLQAAVNKQSAQSIYSLALPGYIALDASKNALEAIVGGYDLAVEGLLAKAGADATFAADVAANAERDRVANLGLRQAFADGTLTKAGKVGVAQMQLTSALAIQLDASANYHSASTAHADALAKGAIADSLQTEAVAARNAYYTALDTVPQVPADISSAYIAYQEKSALAADADFKRENITIYSERKTVAHGVLQAADQLVGLKNQELATASAEPVPTDVTDARLAQDITDKAAADAAKTAADSVKTRLQGERTAWNIKFEAAVAAKAAASNPLTVLNTAITTIDGHVSNFNALKSTVNGMSVPAKTASATSVVTPLAATPVGFNMDAILSAVATYNSDVAKHNLAMAAWEFLSTVAIGTQIRPAGLKA